LSDYLLKEIDHRDKYLTIIPKAINALLKEKEIQNIKHGNEFWFIKAQNTFKIFQEVELPLNVYKEFLNDYQSYNGRYDKFFALVKDTKPYTNLALLLGQLVAYIDEKATAKQSWNNYDDKRTIGNTGVRQNLWVQQLLQYKQAGNNLNAITIPVIQNAIG
jgi:hypothetical protein